MKTFRLFALLTTAVVLQVGVFDTQITPARVTSVVLSVEDSNETELSADEGPESTANRKVSPTVEPKRENPQAKSVSNSDTDKGTVRKQSLPDCNGFANPQISCDLVARSEINPSSPNTANPGQVVQGPGNLIDFKLGNKATIIRYSQKPNHWTI